MLAKLKNPKFRKALLIIVALAVAGFSTFELKRFLETNRPTKRVLVAKSDIMPQTVITSNDLGFVNLPAGSKLPGSLQDPKQIVGKKATTTIYMNEQILPQKVTESQMALGPGERIVSAPTDAVTAVGFTIKPGDTVDVYWLHDGKKPLPFEEQKTIQQAQLLAESATVIDIINKNNNNRNKAENIPNVVVLKIKTAEVQPFVTAVGNGTIYLVKRGD